MFIGSTDNKHLNYLFLQYGATDRRKLFNALYQVLRLCLKN